MSISEKEYQERNLMGFEGDMIMKAEFEKIIAKHNIDVIIETGTYKGGTTKKLCDMVKNIVTIEINQQYFKEAKEYLSDCKNVLMLNGSSPDILETLLNTSTYSSSNILLFLDAHWGNVCPLLDELDKISQAKINPVIIIHDFVVPGKDFGFDSYNGQQFDLLFIEEKINNIYGKDGYTYYYNETAEGAQRGVIYIEPTK